MNQVKKPIVLVILIVSSLLQVVYPYFHDLLPSFGFPGSPASSATIAPPQTAPAARVMPVLHRPPVSGTIEYAGFTPEEHPWIVWVRHAYTHYEISLTNYTNHPVERVLLISGPEGLDKVAVNANETIIPALSAATGKGPLGMEVDGPRAVGAITIPPMQTVRIAVAIQHKSQSRLGIRDIGVTLEDPSVPAPVLLTMVP